MWPMQVTVSTSKAMYNNRLINSIFLTHVFAQSVLRQVHGPLQIEFPSEGDLVLPSSVSSIFSLSFCLKVIH
jgi:hypothetical protein